MNELFLFLTYSFCSVAWLLRLLLRVHHSNSHYLTDVTFVHRRWLKTLFALV